MVVKVLEGGEEKEAYGEREEKGGGGVEDENGELGE